MHHLAKVSRRTLQAEPDRGEYDRPVHGRSRRIADRCITLRAQEGDVWRPTPVQLEKSWALQGVFRQGAGHRKSPH